MASHYYPPQFYYASPYLYPFYNQPTISPFIPPATLLASPEPSRQVRFEDEPVRPQDPRRRSWEPTTNPIPFPSPPLLYTPLPVPVAPPTDYYRERRRSDGNLPPLAWYPAYPTFLPQYVQQPPPAHQLHPILNGESSGGPTVYFDLSLNTFSPIRISAPGQTTGVPLSLDELKQHATHPGIKHMTIKCDIIPQWPIKLEAQRQQSHFLAVPSTSDGPITVGDVLLAIHRSLQRQITHVDWARLSQSETTAVARAYTRRCRTFPSAVAFEKSQGVRQVDYLQDNFIFKGLVRASSSQEGYEKVKLLVGPHK